MTVTSQTGLGRVMVGLAALVVASCGQVPGLGTDGHERPPPITVGHGGQSVVLAAHTYCFGGVCVDGFPREDPPHVGSPPQLEIAFPLDGWSFAATFTSTDVACGRAQTVAVTRSGDGPMVLRPAGAAGAYDVTLFGSGNGDLFVAFRWTTPVDGPMPVPEAQLGILADHDGSVDSYGVEFGVVNLAATPREASATITVTAANGRTLTFTPTPSVRACARVGSLA